MRRPWIAALFSTALAWSTPVDAGDRYLVEPPDVEQSLAFRYAARGDDDCLAELRARGVPFERADPTRGVDTPIRFSGPIRGVTFRPTYRAQPDDKAITTIADCRLGLAIDDLAAVLARNGVVEAQYMSMYRTRGLGWIKPRMRHPGGRAIDLAAVKLADGTSYNVRWDFHPRGGATCGDKASKPFKDTPGARLWRSVVCELGDKRSFNLILTPHYDWGHRDHLHMEVRSGIRWFLIH